MRTRGQKAAAKSEREREILGKLVKASALDGWLNRGGRQRERERGRVNPLITSMRLARVCAQQLLDARALLRSLIKTAASSAPSQTLSQCALPWRELAFNFMNSGITEHADGAEKTEKIADFHCGD